MRLTILLSFLPRIYFVSKWVFTEASFAFSIYDIDGSGKIDAYNLGDVLRALNSNPILATIEKLGGTKKKGEKTISVSFILMNNKYTSRFRCAGRLLEKVRP